MLKCRNKNSENKSATHKNFDTLIFGQCDPGKTPYNSWGKPVRKLLLIYGKCFYREVKCTGKIPENKVKIYLVFCAYLCLGKRAKKEKN